MAASSIGMVRHHDLFMGFFDLVRRGIFPISKETKVKHKNVEFLHMYIQRKKERRTLDSDFN